MQFSQKQRGFTLIDGMLLGVVIVIVASALIPLFHNNQDSTLASEAITFANAMNSAKVVFRTTVTDAESMWSGTDEEKYALLVAAGLMEGWPSSCNGYPDERFSYSLGALRGTGGAVTMVIPRINGVAINQRYER